MLSIIGGHLIGVSFNCMRDPVNSTFHLQFPSPPPPLPPPPLHPAPFLLTLRPATQLYFYIFEKQFKTCHNLLTEEMKTRESIFNIYHIFGSLINVSTDSFSKKGEGEGGDVVLDILSCLENYQI